MTDATNAAATPAADESKAKTVLENMDSRKVFNSTDEAGQYLAKCQADFADFNSYPAVTVGFTEEGDFDPAVYTDSMQVAVAKLTEKGSTKKGEERPSTVKAIVIYPSPKPESVITDPAAQDWLAGLIAKEANLIAMRPLRKAGTHDELADAQDSMPRSLAEYMTSGRETSSGIVETYNSLWQLIKKAMGEKFKAFGLANLSKKELRKAMESASYAAAIYPKLETRQNKAGQPDSYFEKAIKLGQALAKSEGMDSTIFDRMLATRHEKEIEIADDEDGEDFDFDAVAAKLTADKPADAEESTEEAPAEQG